MPACAWVSVRGPRWRCACEGASRPAPAGAKDAVRGAPACRHAATGDGSCCVSPCDVAVWWPGAQKLGLFPSAHAIAMGDKEYHGAVNIGATMKARYNAWQHRVSIGAVRARVHAALRLVPCAALASDARSVLARACLGLGRAQSALAVIACTDSCARILTFTGRRAGKHRTKRSRCACRQSHRAGPVSPCGLAGAAAFGGASEAVGASAVRWAPERHRHQC